MEFVVRKTIIEDLEQLPDLYKSGFGKDTNVEKMYKKFEKLKDDEHYLFYSAVTEENELVGFMNVILRLYGMLEQNIKGRELQQKCFKLWNKN